MNKFKKILLSLFLFAGVVSVSSCDIITPIIPIIKDQEDNKDNEDKKDNTSTSESIKVYYSKDNTVELKSTGKLGTISYTCASDVVDAVADSVVEIVVQSYTKSYWGTQVTSGAGSGVIVNENGYIITNNHVIEDANTIQVTLRNENNYTANLIATDAEADIAIIKIEPTETLTYAVVGDSDNLRVAEDVLAIGNPLGSLGGSVTKGIISAKDRVISIDDYTMTLLQVDAAINSGNSGGGLFDMNGYLIGIVNAKSVGEGIDGIGYAIPSNTAFEVFNDLAVYGYVKGRPTLNLEVIYLSASSAYRNGLDSAGLYVNSGSNNADFKYKDLILSVNGISIDSVSTFTGIIRSLKVGDQISVVIVRDGQQKTITTTLLEQTPSI